MQHETAKWYFCKAGSEENSAFKAGTYRALDLAFGKGSKAAGGICMRSIMRVKVHKQNDGELIVAH